MADLRTLVGRYKICLPVLPLCVAIYIYTTHQRFSLLWRISFIISPPYRDATIVTSLGIMVASVCVGARACGWVGCSRFMHFTIKASNYLLSLLCFGCLLVFLSLRLGLTLLHVCMHVCMSLSCLLVCLSTFSFPPPHQFLNIYFLNPLPLGSLIKWCCIFLCRHL